MAIGIYLQNMNEIYYTWKKASLAVLLLATVGVPPKTMSGSRGSIASPMVPSTTTIRAKQTMCGLFGLFNKPACRQAGLSI